MTKSTIPQHLPTRDGVSASCVFLPPSWSSSAVTSCRSTFDFFVANFPKISQAVWQQRFADGLVVDASGEPVHADSAYESGQHLYYFRHVAQEPHIPFEETVIFQDEHLVVADKPHFLPVTPSGRYVQETLLVRLKKKLNLPHLSPLHRLDRDTAGLVLFSVNPRERGAYQQMFHDRKIVKTYEAIAPVREDLALPTTHDSRMEDSDIYMQMQEVQGMPNSRTHIALQSILPANASRERLGGAFALYELKPVTGKRHQLRVHMNALGIPIVNDGIYPTLSPEQLVMTAANYAKPLQLLAKRLELMDPITGAARVFETCRKLET